MFERGGKERRGARFRWAAGLSGEREGGVGAIVRHGRSGG